MDLAMIREPMPAQVMAPETFSSSGLLPFLM
jgi:hypothetical protein